MPDRGGGVGEQLVDDVLVQHGLLAGQPGPRDLLDLVGKVGDELAVGLGAAEHERLGEPAQPGRGVGVAVRSIGRGEAVPEPLPAAEHARVDGVEDGPQLGEPVLDRRAGERDLLPARSRRTALAAWVPGFLTTCASSSTTVDHAIAARWLDVAGEQPVRRDDEVGAAIELGRQPVVVARGRLGAVVDDDAQRRA